MITSGEFGRADRLPTERELSVRIGLSRPTVREAIRGLEMMGVVDSRHGDGTYITNLDARLLLEATSFVAQLVQEEDVLDLFETRAILDSATAGLAAARATPADLEGLSERLEAMIAADTATSILDADIRFHATVAATSRNSILATLADSLSSRTYRTRFLMTSLPHQSSTRAMYAAHTAIYDAILGRNPAAASAAAAAHVAGTAAWLKAIAHPASTGERRPTEG